MSPTSMALCELDSFGEYAAWWEKEARPLYEEWLDLPFFRELKNGTLQPERLRAWLENWFYQVQECDIHRPVLWSRHYYILARFPQLEEVVTERGGKALNYPYPGGHVHSLRNLATALGISHEELLNARLRPQTLHLTSFLKSLYLEGTLAEFAAQLTGEEYMLGLCDRFQEAMGRAPFNFSGSDLDYFKHWKECLLMRYGSPGRFLLKSLFEKGLVEERSNFGIQHAGKRYAEYLIRLYRTL
jgi:hypothetical protein